MATFLTILFIALLILGSLAAYLRGGVSLGQGNINAKPILTDNEREFFYRLQRALPDFHVFPQVAANAILKAASGVSKQQYHATRNQFAQKHVDFLICERDSLNVVAIIELDDRTHNVANDRKRDAMFEQAGYRVIRFQSKHKPSEAEIADALVNISAPTLTEPLRQEPAFVQTAISPKQDTAW